MSKFNSKKLLKTLTAGRGAILAPHINEYQRRGKFPKEWNFTISNYREDDGHFHPSTDAFLKPSILYLAKKGLLLSPNISPNLRRTFDCGHMWHNYLEAIMVDMGFVRPDDVEVYTTHRIVTKRGSAMGAGTGDMVGVNIPGHGQWLVDIKTMNRKQFDQGASEYMFKKWEAQVNCYGDWFGLSNMMILAVCKDSPHDFREYIIPPNQTLLDEIYDRWTYVAQCLRTNTEPDDDYLEASIDLQGEEGLLPDDEL